MVPGDPGLALSPDCSTKAQTPRDHTANAPPPLPVLGAAAPPPAPRVRGSQMPSGSRGQAAVTGPPPHTRSPPALLRFLSVLAILQQNIKDHTLKMNLIACYGIVTTGKRRGWAEAALKHGQEKTQWAWGSVSPPPHTGGLRHTEERPGPAGSSPSSTQHQQSTTLTALQPLTWFGVPGPGALRSRQPRTLGVHTLSLPWPGGAGHGTTSPSLPTSAGAAE